MREKNLDRVFCAILIPRHSFYYSASDCLNVPHLVIFEVDIIVVPAVS